MDDSRRVCCLQGAPNLQCIVDRLMFCKLANQLAQLLAFHIFPHNVVDAILLAEIVDG